MSFPVHRRACLASGAAAALASALSFGQPARADTLPPRPTPQDWARSPELKHVSLSPDGTLIGYTKEADSGKFLYVYDIAAKAFQTYDLGPAKISDISFIDADHLMITTLTVEKIEAFAGGRDTYSIVSIYNLKTRTLNPIFSDVEGFRSFVSGGVRPITHNGALQVTASSFRVDYDDKRYLYRFDLDHPSQAVLLDRGPWETERWVTTPQGELLARSIYFKKTHTWVLQRYAHGAWKDIFTQVAELDYPSLVGLGRDGVSVVIFMNSGEAQGHYYEVSPEGILSTPLPIRGRTASPLFDPRTYRLKGYSTYEGWENVHFYDRHMTDCLDKAQRALDGYRVNLTDYADDPARLIVYTEGHDDAGTYYFMDLDANSAQVIGHQYPHIAREWLTTKSAIKYKAADGLEIEAYLTLPPNRPAKNLPLVVLPHGGPVARDGLEYDPESQAYASRGYAVLQPNFRGSDGYGSDFVEAGYGQWGRKMQTDLSDGVRELVKQGLVDPKRVCIVGTSYGGYAALAGAAFDHGVYNCAVDVAGVTDLQGFLDDIRGYADQSETTIYFGEKRILGDPKTYAETSPVFHADKFDIPVLVVHGKDDTVVPFAQSTAMVAALKAANKDVTFIQYDHEDHWETNAKARGDMYETIVAFIEKHNPPV